MGSATRKEEVVLAQSANGNARATAATTATLSLTEALLIALVVLATVSTAFFTTPNARRHTMPNQ